MCISKGVTVTNSQLFDGKHDGPIDTSNAEPPKGEQPKNFPNLCSHPFLHVYKGKYKCDVCKQKKIGNK